jgi:uroporphyrin-III C-methyltransferase
VSTATTVSGRVYLVGAGPGDPELLTLKAARLLGRADVVLHDRLVGAGVLEHCRPGAELIFVGKRRAEHHMHQAEIHALMIDRARAGLLVVRLKGGDPLIFGRGGEEIESLALAGIPVEVVPGVTAAAGCAAQSLIPLTHRDLAQTLILVTGHSQDGEPALDWQALCRPRQTLIFYMGHAVLDRLTARLIGHGLASDLAACLILNGTLPTARRITGTLATLPELVRGAEPLDGPALLVVGDVVDRARGPA